MGMFYSDFGGPLKIMPVQGFMRKGRGDDFPAIISNLSERSYGSLAIGKHNNSEYQMAVEDLKDQLDTVMLVGVEDPESGSPLLFAQEVVFDGESYMFPTIFNAVLEDCTEDEVYFDSDNKNFRLRLGDKIDPEQHCTMRILYAPGRRIEWSEDDINKILAQL